MKILDGSKGLRKSQIGKFLSSDWKDPNKLLENIDKELQPHKLELEVIQNYDDQYRVRVIKRKNNAG